MTHAEYMEAAEAMQAQVEEALGIDADTEVCAEIDAETDEPCVMLTAKAVKRLLELFAAERAACAALVCRLCEYGNPIVGTRDGIRYHAYDCGGPAKDGKSCRHGPQKCAANSILARGGA